jgi:hypothetical protein
VPTRFNPPPNWPPAPPGWTPPPGWQPDPAWPAPPQGWPLWVEDTPPQAPVTQSPWEQGPVAQGPAGQGTAVRRPILSPDSYWTIGGGVAVLLGALLPWVSAKVTDPNPLLSGLGYRITGTAVAASAIFGVILIGLGFAMQSKAARGAFVKPRAYRYAVPFIVLAALGVAGYCLFLLAGIVGFTEDDGASGTAKVTFTPSVGLILLIAGCLAALIGGIKAIRHAPRQR